ncbi:MAG: Exodeoxyribonuclease 7 small subunit [Firmicutes bacterium]|nr:Exodeoxyribonuclease 7 small subunit [Bacillota bacterium]
MKKKQEDTTSVAFEEALAKLELIVKELENGDLALEEALDRFAEGMKLSQICLARLNNADRVIDKILREEKKTIVEYPLELEEADK